MGTYFQKNKQGKDIETDVLIVGSGPIGAVYARCVADADENIRILMIDMGEQETRLVGDHKKNNIILQKGVGSYTNIVRGGLDLLSEPTDAFDQNSWSTLPPATTLRTGKDGQCPMSNIPGAPVVRAVGGMGLYWSCAVPEMHPEIERPDLFSDQEWTSLYDKARSLFRASDTAFDHSVRHQFVRETLTQKHKDRQFVSLPLACQRSERNPDYVEWTGSAAILGDLADPKYPGGNFEVKAHHCCRRLVMDEMGGRVVVAAEVVNLLTNEVVMVRAKKYVLCAGTTLSAGILFNSGIRPETGYSAMGHYLTEQTMAVCQVAMREDIIQSAWDTPQCRKHHVAYPDDPLRIPISDPAPEITSPVSSKFPWHTQIQQDQFHYNPVAAAVDPRLVLDLRFFGYVRPVYENCVRFKAGCTDMFGMPRPMIEYQIGQEDAERAEDMMKDMIDVASTLGDFLPGGEPKFLPAGAATHICGTTRAGREDDGHSVVDRYSKVWRLDNLFIGGCSVIPTQNACNPTLTAACFAIVGARKLVEELRER